MRQVFEYTKRSCTLAAHNGTTIVNRSVFVFTFGPLPYFCGIHALCLYRWFVQRVRALHCFVFHFGLICKKKGCERTHGERYECLSQQQQQITSQINRMALHTNTYTEHSADTWLSNTNVNSIRISKLCNTFSFHILFWGFIHCFLLPFCLCRTFSFYHMFHSFIFLLLLVRLSILLRRV